MKIAITSNGASTTALVDSHFGRCAYIAIYDTDSGKVDFIANPVREVDTGAGLATVSLVAEAGVSKIVSGEFGMKIKSQLDELNIQMIVMKREKTIQEIINLLK